MSPNKDEGPRIESGGSVRPAPARSRPKAWVVVLVLRVLLVVLLVVVVLIRRGGCTDV